MFPEILREAAKKNGRNYDPIYLKLLVGKLKPQTSKGPGFLAFFKSKNMRAKTLLLSVSWLEIVNKFLLVTFSR